MSASTVIAILSTSALLYTQWSSLPEWLRLGLTGRKNDGSRRAIDKDANDDLATPTAVYAKLKEMMAIVREVTGGDGVGTIGGGNSRGVTENDSSSTTTVNSMSDVQTMAAFYSLLHLNWEIRAKDPDYRDKLYDDKDRKQHADVELEELNVLRVHLEHAQWAYEESHSAISAICRAAGLDLISHDPATEPGRVGHFVAADHASKVAIFGLKGTSTLSDVLTDLIAVPKEHVGCHFDDETFAAPKAGGAKSEQAVQSMMCHEGIFTAAIWMADHIQPMIENLLVPLNYKVVICGHSLGAGTACLLGLELRSRIAAFRKNYTDLRVYAYATPPVVSYKASRACAPFITSVVNNSDVVPRSSVSNLVVMNKLLTKVHERLTEKGLTVNSWKSLQKYYDEHSRIDGDLLLSEAELDAFFRETHAAPENQDDALFVPGRIVVMWDKGANDNNVIGGIVTDCGMTMLRQVELSLTQVTDHFLDGYQANMTKLIDQLENTK